MPYIKQENRLQFDPVVIILDENHINNMEMICILFEYCKRHIAPSYNNYKNFCGELRQCATEIERRKKVKELSTINENVSFEYEEEDFIEEIIETMKECNIQVNGDLNYILYTYCIRYRSFYNDYSKALRLCAKKIEKEILALYEDQKIKENGDVL